MKIPCKDDGGDPELGGYILNKGKSAPSNGGSNDVTVTACGDTQREILVRCRFFMGYRSFGVKEATPHILL